ncbi:MAG TPA: secretin N-terminal domain-containing protein [Pirellulales bacterium]|nr:secretin N-terminal domain-containing protein [Pirellulales bacterium]
MYGRGGPPSAESEKKDDEKAVDDKKGDEAEKKKVDDEPWRPEPVRRSPWPRWPANPAELEAWPDEDGYVSFRFRGQPWTSVLEWLADISKTTLQWEETPEGYLDLEPRGRYTVDEVRDLITSVLLSKGFALLRKGDVLIVADAKKLDPSLAPRVSVDELYERGNHELVRVLFSLDWMLAESAAEELKPMLGPYGKITALKTANRLDVLGAASNLRRMYELLEEEQSATVRKRLVREFRLRHTRAADVLEKLESLLGVGESSDPAQAMLAQMMSQRGGEQGSRDRFRGRGRGRGEGERSEGERPNVPGPMPLAAEPPADFYLVANVRTNSILVNAPPNKMAKIEQAIAVIDVPRNNDAPLLANLPRVQTYRLAAIDPETLVKVLNELGGLDAATRLEVDAANAALIAYGSLADQMLIRSLVDVLDGTSRRFEVIQLRTLSAEFVAGSIQTLMVGPQQNESTRSRFSSSASPTEADRFQVEADIEHNRLLLRANDSELAEIRSLLMKLGEIPAPGSKASTVRLIPAMPGKETDRLLDQIRHIWPALGPNPLEVEPGENPPEPGRGQDRNPDEPQQPPEEPPSELADPQASLSGEPSDGRDATPRRFRFAQQRLAPNDEPLEDARPESEPPANEEPEEPLGSLGRPAHELPRAAHAPVRVTVGPYGLVISSADAEALDRLEELTGNLMPARLSYKVFAIKNTYAKDLALLLQSIYKNDDQNRETGSSESSGFSRRFGSRSSTPETPRNSLSRRRPLSFVPDSVTNTILVQGADANQLAEIESLIKLYDGDDVPDSKSVRETQLVALRYAKAVEAAEVVKDVYRDLLSPNDKALQRNLPNPQQQQREGGFRSQSFSYLSDDADATQNIPRFKGMLSIGIDERSNSLAVSAPQILMADVLKMIERLDAAAKPTRPVVRILKLRQPGSALQIERALIPGSGATAEAAAGSPASATPPSEAPPAAAGLGGGGRRGRNNSAAN